MYNSNSLKHHPAARNLTEILKSLLSEENVYVLDYLSFMAEAILKLIKDLNKARRMGMEGRKLVEQTFSMEVTTHKLNDVYELTLKRR